MEFGLIPVDRGCYEVFPFTPPSFPPSRPTSTLAERAVGFDNLSLGRRACSRTVPLPVAYKKPDGARLSGRRDVSK